MKWEKTYFWAVWLWLCDGTHIVAKQLHDKGGDASVDADKDVDAGQDDVRRAGDLKEERRWVHQGCDGPPENNIGD